MGAVEVVVAMIAIGISDLRACVSVRVYGYERRVCRSLRDDRDLEFRSGSHKISATLGVRYVGAFAQGRRGVGKLRRWW